MKLLVHYLPLAIALLGPVACCKSHAAPSCQGDPDDPLALSLVDAAAAGDEAEVDRLLALGANVRHVDARKNDVLGIETCPTALHRAAARGHCAIARRLIVAGSSIEHSAFGGWRPLHAAVQSGQTDCVRALLEARAAVDAPSELGYTPLREAIPIGSTEIIRMLLDAGANPDVKDARGESPRMVARRFGGKQVRELIDR